MKKTLPIAPLITFLILFIPAHVSSQIVGLDTRPTNTTCVAPPRPIGTAEVTVEDAFPTISFNQPVKLLQPPGDASRWFVLEKPGVIKVINVANPETATTWLDLSDRVDDTNESGLLGLAFHPDYPATSEIYIFYSSVGNLKRSVVSRLILDDVTAPENVGEQRLLTISQKHDNHKGGDIAFGSDGYLYIGVGDGGESEKSQDTTKLHGSMLRIDVLGVPLADRYRIPPDNPFADNPRCGTFGGLEPCPEIYAWGFRNPWRWNFDQPTGALWLGDVGQLSFEEVNLVELGGNYGWDCLEGTQAFNSANCPEGGLIDPVVTYGRGTGNSVTGGVIYRGSAIPSLHGQYIFGDYGSGWIGVLQDDGSGGLAPEELIYGPDNVTAFALDQAGEVYYVDVRDGRVRRLIPSTVTSDPIPSDLASTGCVDPANPTQPAEGLIPYEVNAPFWSDGATKERWMAVPNYKTIRVDEAGKWRFPTGSVLVKNFRLDDRLIETRLFMRHPDGIWAGYTYEWNESQTAATRVVGGKSRFINGQVWLYPSEQQCRQCHVFSAGNTLGLENLQLNRDITYPATGRKANQLDTLSSIGMFNSPLQPSESIGRLADPVDSAKPLPMRARAYLHTNCAQCHRAFGPAGWRAMDLRSGTALQDMGICDVIPTAGDLGIDDARIVARGNAVRSVLTARAGRRDAGGMPPVGSHLVDAEGVTLLSAWIDGLRSCIDTDNDEVDDGSDNCIASANTDQLDTDGDGYGNYCDADFNNDGFVNFADLAMLKSAFGTVNPNTDMDGNGFVNFGDLAAFKAAFGKPPGPSGLAP